MKTLKDTINEALISEKTKNKIKNLITKILNPFSKTYNLPYICIHNGNCFAPGYSIKENNNDINNLIDKCIKFLKDNYKDKITKEEEEEFIPGENSDIIDGFIFELANCEDNEAAEIYTKLSDYFMKEAKSLSGYGNKQLYHDNFKKDAYIDNYSVELEIKDDNNEFKHYIYPSIELITHNSIKK